MTCSYLCDSLVVCWLGRNAPNAERLLWLGCDIIVFYHSLVWEAEMPLTPKGYCDYKWHSMLKFSVYISNVITTQILCKQLTKIGEVLWKSSVQNVIVTNLYRSMENISVVTVVVCLDQNVLNVELKWILMEESGSALLVRRKLSLVRSTYHR